MNLAEFLNSCSICDNTETAYTAFEKWVNEEHQLNLYPAQEEAILGIALGSNVILATPTGTGKSLVALGAHFIALTQGRRTVYTAPIKALVSEKFFELVTIFGAERVGMITGDATINPDAPLICCTAEILANLAIRDKNIDNPNTHGITQVIMDEFHFYADPERGWAWQVPLLLMRDAQFLLMSATLGDVTTLTDRLSQVTGRDTALVTGAVRPVPLNFNYEIAPAHEVVERLVADNNTPAYLVHFNQSHAVEQAQALASLRIVDRAGRDKIAAALGNFRFSAGFGATLSRLIRAGIGVHHAGMLPRYRRLVEQFAKRGLLKVICGTDTLGVGINVPIRTVVITALTKYDGEKMRRLTAREFHQIAGRAGRAGFDTEGDVIVLAPAHEVENAQQNAKTQAKIAAGKKVGKGPKKKTPPQGFVGWSEQSLNRLVNSQPEALTSQMRITHSMVLGVIGRAEEREGEAITVMRQLIFGSHEPRAAQYAHARTAIAIFRTLRRGGIVTLNHTTHGQRLLHLNTPLQDNFALNQPLSPFALAAIELLDPESEHYTLDVISIIEATLEQPRPILRSQENKARAETIATLKEEGVEYEQRMQTLEEVTHPQPLKELLETAFEAYTAEVPWARDYQLQPKSVLRDMIERAFNFRDLVSFYQLGRSEGVVLRYLSDAYRAMERTVPDQVKNEHLDELIDWLGELVRQVDSSLLDEWQELTTTTDHTNNTHLDEHNPQKLTNTPNQHDPHLQSSSTPPPRSVLTNERAFTVMLRNTLFRRVQAAAFEKYDELDELDKQHGFSAQLWRDALTNYYEEYDEIGINADARSAKLLEINKTNDALTGGVWRFRQVLLDPAGDRDWAIEGSVDLAASEKDGEPVVRVERVGPKSRFW